MSKKEEEDIDAIMAQFGLEDNEGISSGKSKTVKKKKKNKKKKAKAKTKKMSPLAKKVSEKSLSPKLKISPSVAMADAIADAIADDASLGVVTADAAVEPLHKESERMVKEALATVGNPATITKDDYEKLLEELELADQQYKKEQENAWHVAGKEYPPMKDFRKIQTTINDIHRKNRLPRIAEIYKQRVAAHMPANREDLRAAVMNSPHVVNPRARLADDREGLLIDIPRKDAGAPLKDLLAAIDKFETEEGVTIKGPSRWGDVSGLHIHAVPISKRKGHRAKDFEITMRFNDNDDGEEIGTVRIRGPHSMFKAREWSVPVGRRGHPKNKTIREKHDIKYGKIPEAEDGTSLQKVASLGGQLRQSLLLAVENPEFWGGAGGRRRTRKRRRRKKTRKRRKIRRRGRRTKRHR